MSDDLDRDLDTLLRTALAYADHTLKGSQPFFPFGFGLTPERAVELEQTASIDPATNAPELVELLWAAFRTKAADGSIIACAVGYDASIGSGPEARDAVAVAIEHRDAPPKTFFVPYRKRRFRGIEYDFDGRSAQEGESRAFSSSIGEGHP